jgi:hypothetical protein
MVVIEMNTPMRAPVFDSVSDITPTMAAATATTTENRWGGLMRSDTGRRPSSKCFGARPNQRMHNAKSSVTATASRKPASSTSRPRRTGAQSRRSRPRATAMIALYSGPTTIAPTIRICELVRMPQAPMSPANTSSAKKLGAYTAPAWILASTSSHTGALSPW